MIAKSSEEAKQLQREYLRAWRKKNPDKLREYRIAYWEKKARESEAKTNETVSVDQ